MKITNLESIVVLREAKELAVSVYASTNNLKDYGFVDQLRRTSVSVMNNIAEGYERRGDRELKHFLYIAKGSCGEQRSMIALAMDLGYLSDLTGKELLEASSVVSKRLSAWIKTLDRKTAPLSQNS